MVDVPRPGRGPIGNSKPEPDAYGQAALILAESTLHALVDNTTFSSAEAVIILQIAAEVKAELAATTGESDGRLQESLQLLTAIRTSFEASDAS